MRDISKNYFQFRIFHFRSINYITYCMFKHFNHKHDLKFKICDEVQDIQKDVNIWSREQNTRTFVKKIINLSLEIF